MIRSESLDIALENRKGVIWLFLAGHFHSEQVPGIREKLVGLMNDGVREFVIDLEGITGADDAVAPMFLAFLNTLKGKNGELSLIFKNDTMTKTFQPYINIFTVYPDARMQSKETLIGLLKKRGKRITKKTGIRISRSVAIFMLTVLCGWFFTLLTIIHTQNARIYRQRNELQELGLWKLRTEIEVEELRERLQPFEQLGFDTKKGTDDARKKSIRR